MKNLTLLALLVVLVSSCSKEEKVLLQPQEIKIDYQKKDIDTFIASKTQKGQVFDWADASAEMIHSAAMQSDELLAIGYQPDGVSSAEDIIGTQEKLPQTWLSVRQQIIEKVLAFERERTADISLKQEDIIAFELDDEIPTLSLKSTSLEAVKWLKSQSTIRYVEPMGYEYAPVAAKSSAGCGSTPNYSINSSDYTTTSSFNAKIPWNFYNHQIPQAWNYSSGDNIGICIIDTGGSYNQDNIGSQFTSGNSGSRYVRKYSTKYSGSWWWKSKDSADDPCGHGTSMAGLAAAPWSTDGNAMGVAYKANLITVRAVEDVIISSSNEKNGVKDALKLAGNRSDVKIVSMSIGNIISSGTVRDGIYYAYNRGKLLLAAAGTSTSFTNWAGVIFPANMSQTVAVTGVKAQSSYNRCNTCHSGSKVDFTIQMQRSWDNNRTSLALARYGNQPGYISGSSCATATTAGIAALVWARNPSWSRTTVVNKMKVASQNYPSRNSNYGWGNINARAAVLGQSY